MISFFSLWRNFRAADEPYSWLDGERYWADLNCQNAVGIIFDSLKRQRDIFAGLFTTVSPGRETSRIFFSASSSLDRLRSSHTLTKCVSHRISESEDCVYVCVCVRGAVVGRISGQEGRSAKAFQLFWPRDSAICPSGGPTCNQCQFRGGPGKSYRRETRTTQRRGGSRSFLVQVTGRCQCKCQGNVPSQAGKPTALVTKRNHNT